MLVNGTRLVADPSGALWWPEMRALLLADLHLEKGSSLASRGYGMLPPYDTRATLTQLEQLLRHYRPASVYCLGDSFHDAKAESRLGPEDIDRLKRLTAATDWVWLLGNHDPQPPRAVGGRTLAELQIGPLVLRHAPSGAKGEIAGHLHPKAAVRVRGRRISGRCFVTDGLRLVMPAFGAYTGGLCVLDAAFGSVFRRAFHAWIIGERSVVPVPANRLEPFAWVAAGAPGLARERPD